MAKSRFDKVWEQIKGLSATEQMASAGYARGHADTISIRSGNKR